MFDRVLSGIRLDLRSKNRALAAAGLEKGEKCPLALASERRAA